MSLSSLGDKTEPIFDALSIPTEDRFPVMRRTVSHAARSLFAGKLLFPIENCARYTQHCFSAFPEKLFHFKSDWRPLIPCFNFVFKFSKISISAGLVPSFTLAKRMETYVIKLQPKLQPEIKSLWGQMSLNAFVNKFTRQSQDLLLSIEKYKFEFHLDLENCKILPSAFENERTQRVSAFTSPLPLHSPSLIDSLYSISESLNQFQKTLLISEMDFCHALYSENFLRPQDRITQLQTLTFSTNNLKNTQNTMPAVEFCTLGICNSINLRLLELLSKISQPAEKTTPFFYVLAPNIASVTAHRLCFSIEKSFFSKVEGTLSSFLSFSGGHRLYKSFKHPVKFSLPNQRFHLTPNILKKVHIKCERVPWKDAIIKTSGNIGQLRGEHRLRRFVFWPSVLFKILKQLYWISPIREQQKFEFLSDLEWSIMVPKLQSDIKQPSSVARIFEVKNKNLAVYGRLTSQFRFLALTGAFENATLQNELEVSNKYIPMQKNVENKLLINKFKDSFIAPVMPKMRNNILRPPYKKRYSIYCGNLTFSAPPPLSVSLSSAQPPQNMKRYKTIRERVQSMSILADSPSLRTLHQLTRPRKIIDANIDLRMNQIAFSLLRRWRILSSYILTLEADLLSWRLHKQPRFSRIVNLRCKVKYNFSVFNIDIKLPPLYYLESRESKRAIHLIEFSLKKEMYIIEPNANFVFTLRGRPLSLETNSFNETINCDFKDADLLWEKVQRLSHMKIRFKTLCCNFSTASTKLFSVSTKIDDKIRPSDGCKTGLSLRLHETHLTIFKGSFSIRRKKPMRSLYNLRNPRKWLFNFKVLEYIPALYSPAGITFPSHPNRFDACRRIPTAFMGPAFRVPWRECEQELSYVFYVQTESYAKISERFPFMRKMLRPTLEKIYYVPQKVFLPRYINPPKLQSLAIREFDYSKLLPCRNSNISSFNAALVIQERNRNVMNFVYVDTLVKNVMTLFDIDVNIVPHSLVQQNQVLFGVDHENLSNIETFSEECFAARWRTLRFPYTPSFNQAEMRETSLYFPIYGPPESLSIWFGDIQAFCVAGALAETSFILSALPINEVAQIDKKSKQIEVPFATKSFAFCKSKILYPSFDKTLTMDMESCIYAVKFEKFFEIAMAADSRKFIIPYSIQIPEMELKSKLYFALNRIDYLNLGSPHDFQLLSFKKQLLSITAEEKYYWDLRDLYNSDPFSSVLSAPQATHKCEELFAVSEHVVNLTSKVIMSFMWRMADSNTSLKYKPREYLLLHPPSKNFTSSQSRKAVHSSSKKFLTVSKREISIQPLIAIKQRFSFVHVKIEDLSSRATKMQQKVSFAVNDKFALQWEPSSYSSLKAVEFSLPMKCQVSRPKTLQLKLPSVPDWIDIGFSERLTLKSCVDFQSSQS